MSNASDAILARYAAVERESDTLGRIIAVKRLRPSQMSAIEGMTADLEGNATSTGPDGKDVLVPKRTPFVIAASVVEIDGNPVMFPKNRAELNSIFDALDIEGMTAAAAATARIYNALDVPKTAEEADARSKKSPKTR